jgi:hypothetical protein
MIAAILPQTLDAGEVIFMGITRALESNAS